MLGRVLITLLVVLFATPAFAATPEMRTQIEADTVSVGDDLHLTLTAMSTSGETPSDPRLAATPGFSVRGTSVAPSTSISIINGVRTDKRGLNVTWTLHAERLGSFVIGPPSVQVGGTRFAGQSVRVMVVPAGRAPPRRQQGSASPLDPWKGFFQLDMGGANEPREPEVVTDPKLSLDAPRAPIAFLHATIDKTNAVVGEQVTLSILEYVDALERRPDYGDRHEATAAGFVKRSLLEQDDRAKVLGAALIGGRLWNVLLIRKHALFPLTTGDLEIGPMALQFPTNGGTAKRESESLFVHVTEPPLAGRPPGYTLGNVGHYDLSTEVTPREIDRGGAIGVTIGLSGTGNLPAQLSVPARAGIEWLTPEVHDKFGATRGDVFGGKRTFSYVVRVQKEGDVDLGQIELAYWDPDARAYGVARAPIGTIHVAPNGVPATADGPADLLPGLPDARPSLAPARAKGRHAADSLVFWIGLGILPLASPFFAGARAAVRGVRARSASRAKDPRAEMKTRIAEADAASKGGDPRAVDAATGRALEATAIACVRVNLRGTTGAATEADLAKAGLDETHARDVVALYRECAAARFSPGDASAEGARMRWKNARGLIRALEKAPHADVE